MQLGFQHTYAAQSPRFFSRVEPAKVEQPRLLAFNARLAADLGLNPAAVEPEAAAIFSGQRLPEDAQPIAMAYAGHQFGGFVPRLGDGRALLLGELRGRDGILRDVQLKGSGLTPFSRNGDGRAAVGPMLREYLISEAMYALGIPTTRSLAVVATGEKVYREDVLPGAVLTRVAASHIRVGTFQYFAVREDTEALRELLGYVIARHYPDAANAASPALDVLKRVADHQASLIAHWMRVGFIHGVMNTDNMAISGETIDYGPCAFMDGYHPARVFSSIDHNGRYAYANQPVIAQWNLARFAETLLPLIDAEEEKAVAAATEVVQGFMPRFDAYFLKTMREKLGLSGEPAGEGDSDLIRQLFALMQAAEADFTLTFRRLADVAEKASATDAFVQLFSGKAAAGRNAASGGPAATAEKAEAGGKAGAGERAEVGAWLDSWQRRLEREPLAPVERAASMRRVSPAFIPRNHRVEAALSAASDREDLALFQTLLQVLQRPYDDQPEFADYASPPEPSDEVYQTFCGT